MAAKKNLILRRRAKRGLEGRAAAIQQARPGMRRTGRILLAVGVLIVVAGCARGDAASDQGQRQGGFYGGIGGGFTR